jgi:hypothetical protein
VHPKTRHVFSVMAALLAVVLTSVFVLLPEHAHDPDDCRFITRERMDRLAGLCEKFYERAKTWPTNGTMLAYFYPREDKNNFLDGWGREIIFQVSTNGKGELKLISYGLTG